jgi:SAM-dependent methyltransferase
MPAPGNVREYLEAKRLTDLRSVSRPVFTRFKKLFAGVRTPRVLDAGTGTGLMIRRLLAAGHPEGLDIWGVDIDPGNCAAAAGMIRREMVRKGYGAAVGGANTPGDYYLEGSHPPGAERGGPSGGARVKPPVRVRILCGDFLGEDFLARTSGAQFDCVTAHAFMDLVPLDEGVERAHTLLRDGGIFYSSINYDGLTRLLPLFEDRTFGGELLRYYDETMDRRKKEGRLTGGSRTGSLLFNALEDRGFEILDYGSSDWQVFPRDRTYRNREKTFLRHLLGFICSENKNNPRVDGRLLEKWREERLGAVEDARLSLFTHQADVLAVKRGTGDG